MIDVKEATKKAAEYLSSFYPYPITGSIQLEEVELTENKDLWIITLSFEENSGKGIGFGFLSKRYKQFTINAETGEFISMKIREIK